MTGDAAGRLTIPGGLARARADKFAQLVGDIAGLEARVGNTTYVSAALLFLDPAVQAVLALPTPDPGDMLIHEYQGLDIHAALPFDTPLVAVASGKRDGARAEYRIALGREDLPESVELRTGLRLAAVTEVVEAEGLQRRPEAEPPLYAQKYTVRAPQIARYCEIPGDDNPIHLDRDYAHNLGLPARIVPGVLLLALLQPACTALHPDRRLTALKARFVAPIYEDRPFAIRVIGRTPTRARAFFVLPDGAAAALADLEFAP